MTKEQIKYMVDRFLGWKLPKNFNPDAGIKYVRPNYSPEVDATPSGTNLLDAAQAEAMIRYVTDGMPDVIADLRAIHSALDTGLGDSDVTHIESDEELRERHPFQWAASRLAGVIQKLESIDEL